MTRQAPTLTMATGPGIVVDQGETYFGRVEVRDATGALIDATTVTATVTLPDATTASATVTHGTTGVYDIDYLTTAVGRHDLVVTASGTALPTGVVVKTSDVFTITAPAGMLVGPTEAMAHLRASGVITSTADLAQLRWLCQAITEAVEGDLGRVLVRRSVTETHDGRTGPLILNSTPVISITSVVEDGVTLAAGDYVLKTSAGLLYRGTSTAPTSWSCGIQNVTVTMVCGYLTPPAVARKVAMNGIERMWQASQQAPHPALDVNLAITVAAGTLTPLEMASYNALRATL